MADKQLRALAVYEVHCMLKYSLFVDGIACSLHLYMASNSSYIRFGDERRDRYFSAFLLSICKLTRRLNFSPSFIISFIYLFIFTFLMH